VTKESDYKTAWLIDFDDSFTYNLACELDALDILVEVIHWTKAYEKFLEIKKHSSLFPNIFMFGPGPGHPEEYLLNKDFCLNLFFQEIYHLLFQTSKASNKENRYFFYGVCLGHQLWWSFLNAKVEHSIQAVHGQSVSLVLPDWDIFQKKLFKTKGHRRIQVQRYNSLCIKKKSIDAINIPESVVEKKRRAKSGGHLPTEKKMFEVCYDKDNEALMSYFPKKWLTCQFHPESLGTTCRQIFFHFLKN